MCHRGPPPSGPAHGSLADIVLVSNRGPLAFHFEDGRPVAGTSAGAAWPGRSDPTGGGTGATWVACALERGRPGGRRGRD